MLFVVRSDDFVARMMLKRCIGEGFGCLVAWGLPVLFLVYIYICSMTQNPTFILKIEITLWFLDVLDIK